MVNSNFLKGGIKLKTLITILLVLTLAAGMYACEAASSANAKTPPFIEKGKLYSFLGAIRINGRVMEIRNGWVKVDMPRSRETQRYRWVNTAAIQFVHVCPCDPGKLPSRPS